jgi:hypothetical protein
MYFIFIGKMRKYAMETIVLIRRADLVFLLGTHTDALATIALIRPAGRRKKSHKRGYALVAVVFKF